MSNVIYLSPRAAGKSTLIVIKTNNHNLTGWVATHKGKAIKLTKRK